jgi:hypothetical protein
MPILSLSQLFLQRRTLESTASLALSLGSLEKDAGTAGAMGALERRAWAARPRGRSGPWPYDGPSAIDIAAPDRN